MTETQNKNNNELYEIYIVPNMADVKSLVKRYNNNSTGGLYDEMFSEVCIMFHKYIHTYDPDRKPSTWIHLCIQRKVAEILNKYKKECDFYDMFTGQESVEAWSESKSVTEADDCLNEDWYKDNLDDCLYTSLFKLEPQYRNVFLLKYFGGYKIAEIREYVNEHEGVDISISAIKSRLKTAREKIIRNIHLSEVATDLKNKIKTMLSKADNSDG